MKYECYFDGSITFNPGGDMTIGGLVYELNKDKREKIYEFSDKFYAKDFPDGTSNNVAEAMALDKILAFFITENNTYHHICVYGDSQIVINRAKRRNRTGSGIFIPYINSVIDNIQHFNNIDFRWIRREFNTEADFLTKST